MKRNENCENQYETLKFVFKFESEQKMNKIEIVFENNKQFCNIFNVN